MADKERTDSDTVSCKIDHEKEEIENSGAIIFEDALLLTGFGKYNYRLLTLSIYTLLAAIAEVFSVGIIVTSSQCDLDIGVFEKGIISSVPILGVIASAHLWGYLADTRGRLYTLRITIIGTVIGAFISSFANHWASMTFSKFMSSIFGCGSNAVVYTLLGESTLITRRARFLLYATTGIMFSQGVISRMDYLISPPPQQPIYVPLRGTVVAFPILQLKFAYYIPFLGFYYRPWRLLIQIIALLSFINFFLMKYYMLESPKFYFSKGEHELGMDALKKIYTTNTGKDMDTYEVNQDDYK